MSFLSYRQFTNYTRAAVSARVCHDHSSQFVAWEHRDPSGASARTWSEQEFDPLGADTRFTPQAYVPDEGALISYGDSYNAANPAMSYTVDGIRVTADNFIARGGFWLKERFSLLEDGARASANPIGYRFSGVNQGLSFDALYDANWNRQSLSFGNFDYEGWGTGYHGEVKSIYDSSWSGLASFLLASPQNPGIKAPLNAKDAKLYEQERMGALGRLAFSPNCRKFLADHGIDVKALMGAVRNQSPFDGTKSTITRLAAGVVTMSNPTDVALGYLPIKADFNPRGGTNAETGIFPGGTLGATVLDRSDVYFRRAGINTATILHEALHSLLGEIDPQIQQRFGLSTTGLSNNITQELRKHDCAE